jgi:hypothetical protein
MFFHMLEILGEATAVSHGPLRALDHDLAFIGGGQLQRPCRADAGRDFIEQGFDQSLQTGFHLGKAQT